MAYVMISEERETMATYDAIASEYDYLTIPHWKDKFVFQFIDELPGKRILDVGCGTGRNAILFTSEGLEYTGIDFSHGMLSVAEHCSPEAARFARMNICELGFRSEAFDGFLSITSYMHLPKLRLPLALLEAKRVLVPSGVGLISIPYGTHEGMYAPINEYGKILSNCWLTDKLLDVVTHIGFDILCVEEIGIHSSDMIVVIVKKK